MDTMLDTVLRAAPLLSTGAALLAAMVLGPTGAGAVALATGACGALGDATAHLLKILVFGPMYQKLGRETLPILGRGSRPPGATRCGLWPLSRSQPKPSFGMPSGHATHALAMFTFALALRPRNPSWFWRAALAALGLLAVVIPISRVALGCHTVQQAVLGAVLGTAVGLGCAAVFPRELAPQ